MNWRKFLSAEDTAHDVGLETEIFIFDGCDYHIDYIDIDAETGAYYMSNNTQPEHYILPTEPVETEQ